MKAHEPRAASRRVFVRSGSRAAALGLVLLAAAAPVRAQRGCFLFADLWPGEDSANPSELTYVKGVDRLVFAATDAVLGRELWVSDGTPGGTAVLDLGPGPANPRHLIAIGQSLARYWGTVVAFAADSGGVERLWLSDGTLAGTAAIATPTGSVVEVIDGGVPGVWWHRAVYFVVATGSAHELWRYTVDLRTPASSTALTRLHTAASIGSVTAVSGQVYWVASSAAGAELWRTFLTGTKQFGTFDTIGEVHSEGPYLYFAADDGVAGNELWQIHISDPAAQLVEDLAPGGAASDPAGLVTLRDGIYYAATGPATGRELRRVQVQRTPVGSALVWEAVVGAGDSNPYGISAAPFRRLQGGDVGSLVYFRTASVARGDEVWVHDVDGGVTRWLGTVSPAAGDPGFLQYGSGEFVLFGATTVAAGDELWVSDGTVAGTRMVCDDWPGAVGSGPGEVTQVGCDVFYVADDGEVGRELYRIPHGAAGIAPPVISKFGEGGVGYGGLRAQVFASHVPRPAQTFGLYVNSAAPNAPAALLIAPGCNPVAVPFGVGCSYYLGVGGVFASAASTNSSGFAVSYLWSASTPVPSGAAFTAQWAVLDAAGCWLGAVGLSDAMRVVVGL